MRFHRLLLTLFSLMILGATPLVAIAKKPKLLTKDLPSLLSGQDEARAISYSGYRSGQAPGQREPSYQEVSEDLHLLAQNWNLLRLYGGGTHAETVLEVISKEKLPLKVMQGVWLRAEVNNPNCPWGKPVSAAELRDNHAANLQEIDRVIALAKKYPDIITAVNVGNEILVDWTDHLVPVPSVVEHVKRLKAGVTQLVTVADNYVPWSQGRDEIVELLDFITVHTYPIWEHKTIEESLAYTKANIQAVAQRYPNKAIAIGEAGWATGTNGAQISVDAATEPKQKRYFEEFSAWTQSESLVGFFFSAFDEEWKGGNDPAEPEKHWGLFKNDRSPKLAIQHLYAPKENSSTQKESAQR